QHAEHTQVDEAPAAERCRRGDQLRREGASDVLDQQPSRPPGHQQLEEPLQQEQYTDDRHSARTFHLSVSPLRAAFPPFPLLLDDGALWMKPCRLAISTSIVG